MGLSHDVHTLLYCYPISMVYNYSEVDINIHIQWKLCIMDTLGLNQVIHILVHNDNPTCGVCTNNTHASLFTTTS